MVTLKAPEVIIRFPALGREFTSPISYRLDSDYFASTDGFEIELYHPDPEMTRGLELQPIEVFIDGTSQLVGRVDVTEISDSRAVTIQGRDYIADLVECNVDPTLKILKGESVAQAIIKAAWPVGIGKVLGDDQVLLRNVRTGTNIASGKSSVSGFQEFKMEDFKPEAGDGIFEFVNRIAARHGGTLQPSTVRSELVFSAPNYDQEPACHLQVIDNSAATNVISATARRDFSTVPTHALFLGRGGDVAKKQSSLNATYNISICLAELSEGYALDAGADIRSRTPETRRLPDQGKTPALGVDEGEFYRLLYHKDDSARNQGQIESALARSVSERAKDTLSYTCTVRGHSDPRTGALYAIDTIASVNDEIRRVDEEMWVSGRTFSFDAESGPTTELRMVRKFMVQLNPLLGAPKNAGAAARPKPKPKITTGRVFVPRTQFSSPFDQNEDGTRKFDQSELRQVEDTENAPTFDTNLTEAEFRRGG